jgi:hypothetical protein
MSHRQTKSHIAIDTTRKMMSGLQNTIIGCTRGGSMLLIASSHLRTAARVNSCKTGSNHQT